MNQVISVLIIEDEPAHVELIARAFDRSADRYRVSVAGTLAAARSLLREREPDLIIADWRLPDGDGLELVRSTDGNPKVPVVLMTSHGNERVAVEAIKAGAVDYVVKSVESLADMPHTADRALRLWRHQSERDRMHAALEASERKYRFLADHIVDVVWTMDLQMRLTFVSPSAANMYGWSPEEMTGLQPQDYLPPASIALAKRALDEQLVMAARPDDEGVTLVMEQYRKDGATFWTEVKARLLRDQQGAPENIIGSTRDISERKRVEQELVREKAFSDMVIDSLPGIFYICDEQGMLLRWNDNEKAVTGYTREELSRMNLLRLFVHDRELMAAHLQEVFESGRASVEAAIVTKSGTAIPFYLTGFRMTADDRRYLVGVGIDISERKRLERQLLHVQKMESIGQLAGGIAHDFNNILAAIVGYGSILQTKMKGDVLLQEHVKQILSAAERAAKLTQSLLAFSRKQIINPRQIDLNESIRTIERFLARIIGEDIMLTTVLSADTLTIYADVTQIEQVLMNLVTNARDAMPKGGRLAIETAHARLDDDYIRMRGYGTPGLYAMLTVSDTGEGMDEETQKKIFEPFFTTKEVGRGTGLGLSIVYGIVKQNNGYINVYSEPGRGTTFKIYLPIVGSPAGAAGHVEVAEPLRGGSETILFAEDDEAVRRLHTAVLEEAGYTVIEAADGEEALRKLGEHHDRISLFILDVIMPRKNGREVYEEARRSKPDLKALFMSGYPADFIQKEGVLEEGLHFLSKPSSPETLLRKVRELLDQ